jgi:hypothetical protein
MRISATGNVGIGTTATGAKLQIADGGDDGTNYGSVQIIRHHTGHLGSHLSFIRAASNVMGLGYGQSSSSFGFGPGVATAFSPTHLSIDTAGSVGIGTTTPTVKLDVVGNIKANGKSVPVSDESNLRIIRGTVKSDGTVLTGNGTFTVYRVPGQPGLYQITFTTAFSGTPTITTTTMGRWGIRADVYPAGYATFPANQTIDMSPSNGGFTAGILGVNAETQYAAGFHFIAIGPR